MMNFKKALELAKKGEKIRLPHWGKKSYLYWDKDRLLTNSGNEICLDNIKTCKKWEVFIMENKKIPEKGDLYSLKGDVYYIVNLTKIDENSEYYFGERVTVYEVLIKSNGKILMKSFMPLGLILEKSEYLGKSKANINQLFEVQNDNR